jgi:hypothetical protein
MSSTCNIECFYDYVIDKILSERSISLTEITEEMILSHLYDIFQKKISVSTIFERIKERIALIQPVTHEDQSNNAIPAVEEQASSEGMNLIVNQEPSNENPMATAVDDDMKDRKYVDMIANETNLTPLVTETVVMNPNEIGEPANLDADPSVYQPKLSLNLPPEEETMEDKAHVDSTAMEPTETIQMSQHDCKPVSVPISMGDAVTMEIDMEGGYFKDETNNNDQLSDLNQATSSIPLHHKDTVVTVEPSQLSQPSENIQLTQASVSTVALIGSQAEGGISKNADLVASHNSMFLTNDQPKRKKRKTHSAPESALELVHPYQTRKQGKTDGDTWTKYYEQLKVYYLKNNNCDVPVDFEVKIRTSDNEETLQLGIWLQQEKEKMGYYSAANPERQHLLTVWLSGNPLRSSSTSTAATAAIVSSKVIGKQEFSPSKGKRGRPPKAVPVEKETDIPKSSPPPPPNSVSPSLLPTPSPSNNVNLKNTTVATATDRTESFEAADKETQNGEHLVSEFSSTLLFPAKDSSDPTIEPLSSKDANNSPSKPTSDNDSESYFQQLLDKRQELLENRKKRSEEAANGYIGKLVAFEYRKNNLFYLGLGKVKQVNLSAEHKKLTVVQKCMVSTPSNIEEAVVQETEELMEVDPRKIFSSKANWIVFHFQIG